MRQSDDLHCQRCKTDVAVFRTGPLLGLCRACLENDHIGMSAEREVLASYLGTERRGGSLLDDVRWELERAGKMAVQLRACTESRLAIIEMMIADMCAIADTFEACCRGGYPCGCGSAAKSVRATIRRLREQRPNDGRSGRCGIRISGDAWCVRDIGHGGEHA